MKNKIYILLFLVNLTCFSQKIETLKSNKEVGRFLKKQINKRLNFEYVFQFENEPEDFENMIIKRDIDNNGYQDLIVDAYEDLIVVLDLGNKKYHKLNFSVNFDGMGSSPTFDRIVKLENKNILIFETELFEFDTIKHPNIIIRKNQTISRYNYKTKKRISEIKDVRYRVDSLIVFNNEFVTYNKNKPKKKSIKNIKFETSYCFGTCPVFKIEIKSNHSIKYCGIKYTKRKKNRNKELNSKEYDKITKLINYADIQNLKDNYSVNWTDDQTVTLIVEYDNGDVKKIIDYGMIGSINLQAIYNRFFEINKTIK